MFAMMVAAPAQISVPVVHPHPPCLLLPSHHPPLPPSHQYADPVTDLLDQCGVFRTRLFRESCVFHQGCYVKDLSRLGRDLHKTLILDNSPASYIFHPNNAVSPRTKGVPPVESEPASFGFLDSAVAAPPAQNRLFRRDCCQHPDGVTDGSFFQVPVVSWFDDVDDAELLNLLPLFEDLSRADNVYARLDQLRGQ